MLYVIQRNGEGRSACYVARPGEERSYTPYLQNARVFYTRDAARVDACANERVVTIEEAMGIRG